MANMCETKHDRDNRKTSFETKLHKVLDISQNFRNFAPQITEKQDLHFYLILILTAIQWWSTANAHLRHLVILHCHRDDVDADNCGDGQVKILAACNCV